MLGPTLLRASHSPNLRRAVERNPITRRVVERFVAGVDIDDVVGASQRLQAGGVTTTLDYLGEDVTDLAGARHVRDQYIALLFRLHESGQARDAEVSVKLSALGQSFPGDGHGIAAGHAREICVAAHAVGSRVTLDMEDHTTVDSTLAIGNALRAEFPLTGTVLQANLRRTEADLDVLGPTGARIRLVKGAYREPRSVAFQRKHEVDEAYARGIDQLMRSRCYPMIATHDPQMIRLATQRARELDQRDSDWEVQMLYGIAGSLQQCIVAHGHRLRVYLPFGTDWYGYFMRRLAERPANVAFFLRALGRD